MDKNTDAYGAELIAAYDSKGAATLEIVERDDRYISASFWPRRYFAGWPTWSRREKQAARLMKGRVLDIGSGAGRYALHLQKKGHDVTAIDNSPGAVKVCKRRGVKKALVMSIDEVRKFQAGAFDTVIMMGSNFGLFGGENKARRLLKNLHRITSNRGQIIVETVDPYHTKDPVHLGYHRFNRNRGRMSGQLRIRVRHGKTIGPWFDYLLVSRKEMKQILEGTGWHITGMLTEGPGFTAVLKKE
jgi:SAM-dependent methyltransferase